MANYLSKDVVLSLYVVLSKMNSEHRQGATQLLSSIRYFVALDRFYKLHGKHCDTKLRDDKDLYSQYVGEVVSICDGFYANQFYYPLKKHGGDFCVGSNFYSAGVVKLSTENKTNNYNFPKSRTKPLFNVKDGVLSREVSYYPNLVELIGRNDTNKVALSLWLLRNTPLPPNTSYYNRVVTGLKGIYTDDLVNTLVPDESVFNKVVSDLSLQELSSNIASISPTDIKALFDITEDDALENIKEVCPVILYGPPGTGKTYKLQHNYCGKFDDENQFVVTFHQSFSYEDFVEGLKPIESETSKENITYKIEKGIFYQSCERACILAGYNSLEECVVADINDRKNKFAKAVEDGNFVLLCIDEINRGNISAIFGELISLIEDKKRLGAIDEMTTVLPYSKSIFGVPKNLFILGTMNTADRSIQLLDSALRRRFKFEELLPNYDVPFNNENSKTILKRINARIRCLLNKDNQIGHTYLMFATTPREIFEAIINKVLPLLEEYFYNDIQKVRFVLNENDKTKYPFYKEDKDAKAAFTEYISEDDIDSEDKSFYVFDKSILKVSDEQCGNYLLHLLGKEETTEEE